MFGPIVALSTRIVPIAVKVAPHILPVATVAVREFAIGISIGAGLRTAGDGIVRSIEHSEKKEPFLDPSHSLGENVGELAATFTTNAVNHTREYGPFWAGMGLSTALLPVAPTASAWMYTAGVSWLLRPLFKQIKDGWIEGWRKGQAKKPLDLSKSKKVNRRQRRKATKAWDASTDQLKVQAVQEATASGSTVMGAVPDHIQDGTPDPQVSQVHLDLDLEEIQRNPFTVGVSVAWKTSAGHPERINTAREALLKAMRENTVITDSQAKVVLAGFNSQAKLLRRAA